ncbi:tail fiber domain-containing protein [bacterium]|nr:tail fiber domain-containing protein [bacterium]
MLRLGVNAPTPPAGDLRASGMIVGFYSDIRLKDNIEYIKDANEKLSKLNGVFYTQNKTAEILGYHDYSQQSGLIAQEVKEVLPEIVKEAPITSAETSGDKYLTVQYEFVVPLLVQAIKEQQEEIEELAGILLDDG